MAVPQIPAANSPFMQKILQELDFQGQLGNVWLNEIKQNNADKNFAIFSDFFLQTNQYLKKFRTKYFAAILYFNGLKFLLDLQVAAYYIPNVFFRCLKSVENHDVQYTCTSLESLG